MWTKTIWIMLRQISNRCGLRMDEELLPTTFVHGIPGGIVKSVDIQDSSGGWKWVQVGGEADAQVVGK